MPNVSLTITSDFDFGSDGSGDGELRYPGGIVIINDLIYISDSQNHRIQVFDLSGNYDSQFGNGVLSFPEGIATNGSKIYVADSANNYIRIYDQSQTLLQSETSSTGIEYPRDVAVKDERLAAIYHHPSGPYANLYQRGILANDGLLSTFTWDYYRTSTTSQLQVKLPEGIGEFNNFWIVCDSGNNLVRVFIPDGMHLVKNIDYEFVYPVGIVNVNNEAFGVIDWNGNQIVFFDEQFNYITKIGGPEETDLYFPRKAYFYEDKLYVVDSGNHRVRVYDVTIDRDTPFWSERIMNLTKVLYPTGRAFWMNENSMWYKLHAALVDSEARMISESLKLLKAIIPDNTQFTQDDADNWVQALGIKISSTLSLESVKSIIFQRMSFPSTRLTRQSDGYIQTQLEAAGFTDLQVYRPANNLTIVPPTGYTIIANHINENNDATFFSSQTAPELPIDLDVQLMSSFIIAQEVNNYTSSILREVIRGEVPLERKEEFRELILRLKPAHIVGLLYIDYV